MAKTNASAIDDEVLVDDEIVPDDAGEVVVIDKKDDAPDPAEELAALKAKLAAETARAEAAERREASAKQDVGKFRSQADQAQYDSLVNGYSVATTDLENAENALADAMEAGDFKAAAKAQTAIARATNRVDQLENAKKQMETRRSQKPEPEVNDELAGMTKPTRDWVARNPQFLTDMKFKSKAFAAHHEAMAEGYQADTPEYFEFVDSRLAGGRAVEITADPVSATARKVSSSVGAVAAPSRQQPGARTSGNTVRLSAAQLEAAEMAGVSAAEYAAQLHAEGKTR